MIANQPLLDVPFASTTILGEAFPSGRPAPLRLGSPGRCGPNPSMTISIDDRSPSIWMHGGADPVGQRYSELALAFRRMARSCRCGKCLVAALSFDTPEGDLPPTPIASRGYARMVGHYFEHPEATTGRSELIPALERAEELAAQHPAHAVHLVVLTDWELFEDFAAVKDQLDRFTQVLAIGLNRPTPQWALGPSVKGQELTSTDRTGTLARATFDELNQGRVGTTIRGHRS